MKQTQFTPGPWDAETYTLSRADNTCETGWCVKSGDDTICDVIGELPSPEGEANARLIAAAPELYEALRVLLNAYDELRDAPASDFNYPQRMARAALVKVTP